MDYHAQDYLRFLISPEITDDYLLDDPVRKQCMESSWHKFLHFKEKLEKDREVLQAVKHCFQERYGVNNLLIFERLWKVIGTPIWSPQSKLSVGTLRSIDKAFQKQLIYWGPGITSPESTNVEIDKRVMEISQALFHGRALSYELLNKDLLKAIFVQKNPELLTDFCKAMQCELDHLALHPPQNSHEEVLWRGFLGNVLALLPFAYPSTGSVFAIPILENGVCRQVRFEVEVIPLSTKESPITALGFNPINDATVSPIISFLGTTYPAGDGFAETLLTDMMPGQSVGGSAFIEGLVRLDSWFKDKKTVHAVGTSLGGALCFHSLLRYHDKLTRLDVYNPAGLMKNEWERDYHEGCEIFIYNQFGDLVSEVGNFPIGNRVALYRVFPQQSGLQVGFLNAHVRIFTGCENVAIVTESAKIENAKPSRRFFYILRFMFAPAVILGTFLGLFFYKLWQFFSSNKK